MRTHRRLRRGLSVVASATLALTAVVAVGAPRAYADATAPPALAPSQCPASQYPPQYYQNPTTSNYAPPPNYTPDPGQPPPVKFHGPIPYKVPFSGDILDGQISIPATASTPSVLVPHVFAAVCGQVLLPQLTGVINGSDPTVPGNPPGGVHFAPNSPNVYVGGLEALPITVNFTQPLVAPINPAAAPNGGLNISMTTSNEASTCNPSLPQTSCPATSLGMTCSVVLNNVTFTTQTSGALTGKPVTGPSSAGAAEVVSNDFPVPAVQPTATCPPAVALTFNKLLGLPLAPGVATFTAPFTFVFELDCPPPPGVPASDYPYQCPTGPQK